MLLAINLFILIVTWGKLYNLPEKLPAHQFGLILGTSQKNTDGSLNMFFTSRIDAGVELYKLGKIKKIIVSGAYEGRYYDETEIMRNELIKKGVKPTDIITDQAGFRTYDSVVRAKLVFGADDLTIISQKFHNHRAVFIGLTYGIGAIGFNAKLEGGPGFKLFIREIFARPRAIFDLITFNQPEFMGEEIKPSKQ